MDTEKRTATRVGFGLRLILPQKGETYFTKDISVNGCFVPECRSADIGDKVELALDLPAFGYVLITGEVCHVTHGGTGIMFLLFQDSYGKEALEEFIYVVSLCHGLGKKKYLN